MKNLILIGLMLSACSESPSSESTPVQKLAAEPTDEETTTNEVTKTAQTATTQTDDEAEPVAMKLTMDTCVDPDLTKLALGTTLTLCDGTTGTGTYVAPSGPDLTNLTADNVKTGVTIATVTGTYAGPAQPDLTNLTAGNIKSGVAVNGVTGTYTGAAQPDLTNLTAGNIKTGVVINGVTGTLVPNTLSNCNTDGQNNCVLSVASEWVAASHTQVLAAAGNIWPGYVIAGVTGTLQLPPASVIKKGYSYQNGYIIGDYPSAAHPLTGTSGAALTAATFDARLADSGTVFEWFDSEGTRYTSSGDADLVAGKIASGTQIFGVTGTLVASAVNAQDVRVGTSINGVTGTLKVNCRNNTDTTNHPGMVGVDDFDWFRTFPTGVAATSTADNTCNGSNWVDETTGGTGVCASTNCLLKDKTSNLEWSRLYSGTDWATATANCAALNYYSMTGWRLPSQKELMSAYVDGIQAKLPSGVLNYSNYLWTSTTFGGTDSTVAVYVAPAAGFTASAAKTTATVLYMCVH